jgi:hypothetical protein
MDFVYEISLLTCRVLQRTIKSYEVEPTALLPLRGRHAADFYRP